jgi:predicted RNA binding protein YcfA (HicA-like mRNA interferase family)
VIVLNQKSAQKPLESNGWTMVRGGQHVVTMTNPGRRPITLPHHKNRDYPAGLTSAILRQAGLK